MCWLINKEKLRVKKKLLNILLTCILRTGCSLIFSICCQTFKDFIKVFVFWLKATTLLLYWGFRWNCLFGLPSNNNIFRLESMEFLPKTDKFNNLWDLEGGWPYSSYYTVVNTLKKVVFYSYLKRKPKYIQPFLHQR